MDAKVANYLQTKRIDSFQKLNFLLLLHQYPHLRGTPQEFSERFYLGDISLLMRIIKDFQAVGLLEQVGNGYQLCKEPTVKLGVKKLAQTFANPLDRQEMLNCLKHGKFPVP